MPEMQFQIEWPDGSKESCYSPSLVIKDYLSPGTAYPLEDFLERSRTALNIAVERVREKYGFPCGRAAGQLHRLETAAVQYQSMDNPTVRVLAFHEPSRS